MNNIQTLGVERELRSPGAKSDNDNQGLFFPWSLQTTYICLSLTAFRASVHRVVHTQIDNQNAPVPGCNGCDRGAIVRRLHHAW